MEIVNKILHLWVKVMSHRGEASVKHDRKVYDFCPIITPLDYTVTVPIFTATLITIVVVIKLNAIYFYFQCY